MLLTIVAFIVALGLLIAVHEYGHYRVAVACGVKVLRFSVGFGRVIWRRQATPDSTEFVLSALPLGGYVRMLDEREGDVRPDELHRAFNRKPLLQRAAVVAAAAHDDAVRDVVQTTVQAFFAMAEADATLHEALRHSSFWLLTLTFTLYSFDQAALSGSGLKVWRL